MNIVKEPNRKDWPELIKRPELNPEGLDELVKNIFRNVKATGDQALIQYTKDFDQVIIERILLSENEITQPAHSIPDDLKSAINKAKTNIEQFHKTQVQTIQKTETTTGVICWQESRAIEKIGIYIPGGSAPLFSTVLMLAIPAVIAGCKEIILCSPPGPTGDIHPAILYAASITGITKVARIGGVQAIAALTYGTPSIPSVNKIFGPGNQYVAAAKQQALRMGIATDLPAGPSELLVVADGTAIPAFVAADLLSQAEHGPDSQVICIVDNETTLKEIEQEVNGQSALLPRRKFVVQALRHSKLILLKEKQQTIDFVNNYAPEHLILCTADNDFYRHNLINAGSVFIGNYTPESAGDYASGTNHTLPTNGSAKVYSGVNLDAFVKKITFQQISTAGIKALGNTIEIMAEAEGLQAHKNAVTLRLNSLKQ